MFKCNLNRVVNDENLSEIEGLYRFFLLNVFLYRNNYLRIADAQKRRRFDLDYQSLMLDLSTFPE